MKSIKFLRINGDYFTEDNTWMIRKQYDGVWWVYKAYRPFCGEFQFSCRTLKQAKKCITEKYNRHKEV